jgi:hypothetical protein
VGEGRGEGCLSLFLLNKTNATNELVMHFFSFLSIPTTKSGFKVDESFGKT